MKMLHGIFTSIDYNLEIAQLLLMFITLLHHDDFFLKNCMWKTIQFGWSLSCFDRRSEQKVDKTWWKWSIFIIMTQYHQIILWHWTMSASYLQWVTHCVRQPNLTPSNKIWLFYISFFSSLSSIHQTDQRTDFI